MACFSMNFESALDVLVGAHCNEVQQLRQRIAELETGYSTKGPGAAAEESAKKIVVNKNNIRKDVFSREDSKPSVKRTLLQAESNYGDHEQEHTGFENDVEPMTDLEIRSSLIKQPYPTPLAVYKNGEDTMTPSSEENGMHSISFALQGWAELCECVLSADDPKGLKVFPDHGTWKRWLLLSDRFLRLREDRKRTTTFRPRVIKFELVSVWLRRNITKKYSIESHRLTLGEQFVNDIMFESGVLRFFVLHPQSMKAFVWGLLSGVLVLYDLFMLPLDLVNLATLPNSLSLTLFFFWVADVIVTCLTGVEAHNYVIDMRISSIIPKYARTWMLPDLLLIFMDMVFLTIDLLATVDASAGNFFETLKANKILRLVRLIRLFRLRKAGNAWKSFFASAYAIYIVMIGKLFKHVVVIFTINHYIACMWYGLALWKENEEATWLAAVDNRKYGSAASYAYSLHWALTQVSPSTQNIAPQNIYERSFALCVALFAFMSFSWFVSQVTNALNQLLKAKEDREKQECLLREFFRVRGISSVLGSRIMSFFHRNYEGLRVRTTEDDIEFFSEIPESLRLHLHEEMYLDVLMSHPFFLENYTPQTRGSMLKICHTAMRELGVHPGQDVFILGSDAKYVYHITQGNMVYKQNRKEEDRESGEWISEMALWVKWEHVGSLSASGQAKCELSSIHVGTFHSIFAVEDATLHDAFRLLAIFALQHLEIATAKKEYVTDMPLPEKVREGICQKTDVFKHLQRGFLEHGRSSETSSYGNDNPSLQRLSLAAGLQGVLKHGMSSHLSEKC